MGVPAVRPTPKLSTVMVATFDAQLPPFNTMPSPRINAEPLNVPDAVPVAVGVNGAAARSPDLYTATLPEPSRVVARQPKVPSVIAGAPIVVPLTITFQVSAVPLRAIVKSPGFERTI